MWGSGEGSTQYRQFGRCTLDAGDEKVRWRIVVGHNGPRQVRRVLGEGERAGGMHQTEDMIRKEQPDGQGAEQAWGAGGTSGRGRYVSGVRVVFADAPGFLVFFNLGNSLKLKKCNRLLGSSGNQ